MPGAGPPGVLAPKADDVQDTVFDAIEGDPHAVERLLAAIRPMVVRYCRARVGRQERAIVSADDVAQEVLLAVLAALPSYRDNGRPFLAFVYGIAAHKVVDAMRAAARNRCEPIAEPPDGVSPDAEPEAQALAGELNDHMSGLLQLLEPRQREVVVLRVMVGLSAEETGDALGMSPGQVRVMQHRSLTRLRKLMVDEGWYGSTPRRDRAVPPVRGTWQGAWTAAAIPAGPQHLTPKAT